MGPKSPTKDINGTAWRKIIEEAPLNDEIWTAKVIVMDAAGSDQDRLYLSKFESFATDEKRFVIKCIGKSETIFMINQLGSEKKTKDENLRVFEEGQAFLKDKNDIPSDVLALILKHLMLKMKEEYIFIKRQRLEVMEGLRQESATMIGKEEVRGKPPEQTPSPPPAKSKAKGKGKSDMSEIPEPVEGKKYNTFLRERGEEWRDRTYVDDFPIDGPNIYIAVSGFTDPRLPLELIKIGVPLTAVIQIRINAPLSKIPDSLIRSKRGQGEAENAIGKYLKFWEDIEELRIRPENANLLKNTAFLMFSPPYWESDPLSGSPEKIYDELSFLMYDVQDLCRQRQHYLENMDVQRIPEDDVDSRYLNYYNHNIDDLPLECVTLYSLLDSVLQTACKENLDMISSSLLETVTNTVTLQQRPRYKSVDTRDSDKIQKAKNLVKSIFNSLCNADKKKYRVSYGEEYETHNDPIVLLYGDYVKNTTFHLKNINLDKIVRSTLFGMPLHKLWLLQESLKEEKLTKISYHINILLSCFDRNDVETAELNRLMLILTCRKLYNNRSSLKRCYVRSTTVNEFKKSFLKRSILVEPLSKKNSLNENLATRSPSFPSVIRSENVSNEIQPEEEEERQSADTNRMNSLFYCPDISELVSAAEIANNQPINHMIDDFEFFEDLPGNCAHQVLLDAFNKFNCVDYKYCEVTDNIVMMFFNSHDKDGIYREEWRVHIPTPVCLQDFFDFILDEQYDWIQNEELIYDASIFTRKESLRRDITDNFTVSCIDDTNVDADLIMEGSLKHQEKLELEESTEVSEKGGTKNTTSKNYDSTSTLTDTKSSWKRSMYSSIQTENLDYASRNMPFLGYDLTDRRVEVFGKDAVFFSRDRTRISSYYTLFIPYNVEYVILNVVPGDGNNEFWIHKALGDFISPEVSKRCDSFRINTKDNVMINIKKRDYKIPLPISTLSFLKSSKQDLRTKSAVLGGMSLQDEEKLPQFETKTFYSFCITWPNGLITESVHDLNSPAISHIKQFYLVPLPHLDEVMRCISLKGEVIIFKTMGDVLVLCPDGTYIQITKFGKREVISETVEDSASGKGKQKDKGKEKPKEKDKGKEKDKVKKNIPAKEEKPIEYELCIDEFEIIESSGFRQKWVNDEPYDIENLIIRTATDYCLGEIFSRRMDGTHTLLNKDGIQLVTFPDQTRIMTYFVIEEEEIFPEWTDEEIAFFETFDSKDEAILSRSKSSTSQKSYNSGSGYSAASKKEVEEEAVKERTDGYISVQIIYTIEHKNFTTVSINKSNGVITVDSPNDTSLSLDVFQNYKMVLNDNTSATFDGVDLNISYEACVECKSYTECDIKIEQAAPIEQIDPDESTRSVNSQYWAKLKDSFCKKVVVDNGGDIHMLDEACTEPFTAGEEIVNSEEKPESHDDGKADWKSESSITSHGKCRDTYQAKNLKFIIMNRDLKCSELIHRTVLEEYKTKCHWQPWCYMKQYDTFGDHRALHSILTPIPITETEKWLMNSKMCNKPTYLAYKDLKKDCGKGFYHWMRPYERFQPQPIKPESENAHKLPRAFILRTVEQQWRENEREKLKGAKELLAAILRYRNFIDMESESMLHVPIVDLRLNDQRTVELTVQAVARKIYKDLKERLEEKVQERAKATITTKPLPPEEESLVEGELEDEVEPEILLEEERASRAKEVDKASKMSPNLQRYWRRRVEELKEEQFYLYLLREGTVPRYFENPLGGAIWWELDNLITRAQRRKIKCVCSDNAGEGTSCSEREPYM